MIDSSSLQSIMEETLEAMTFNEVLPAPVQILEEITSPIWSAVDLAEWEIILLCDQPVIAEWTEMAWCGQGDIDDATRMGFLAEMINVIGGRIGALPNINTHIGLPRSGHGDPGESTYRLAFQAEDGPVGVLWRRR